MCGGRDWKGHPGGNEVGGRAVVQYLEPWAGRVERVGLEPGSTSEWLTANLIELAVPAVSLEARR